MITIRHERTGDVAAREALLEEAFGAERFAKTSQRLRDGRIPAEGLSFAALIDGELIGTVRLWNISAGPARPAPLLGPPAGAAPPPHPRPRPAVARARPGGGPPRAPPAPPPGGGPPALPPPP